MAVEAIRAKLIKGEIANCVPWDAPAVELTAGEGNTGMYTRHLHAEHPRSQVYQPHHGS